MVVTSDKVLNLFAQISSIPRCSKHEEAISRWLMQWAAQNRFQARCDRVGNVIIEAPGSLKSGPPVILQAHMDMVCEKARTSHHDFQRDPLDLVYDGKWLRARDTSLGADNGVGMAMALAAAVENGLKRPDLELLFTVDEESGFTGVRSLSDSWLTGRYLLNLDSEAEGQFTIGSAGGKSIDICLEQNQVALEAGDKLCRIRINGLRGGHSGVDIAKHRASAVRLAVRLLNRLQGQCPFRLVNMQGGTAHNAIARDANILLACPGVNLQLLEQEVNAAAQDLAAEYALSDPELSIAFDTAITENASMAIDYGDSCKVIALLAALPHGVIELSTEPPGSPETSCNLAKINLSGGRLEVGCSIRSMFDSALRDVADAIAALSRMVGAQVTIGKGYPAWQPVSDSPLVQLSRRVYRRLFGKQPGLAVIHGGLECGVLYEKYPGLQIISFGPTIENPHSPNERVDMDSIARTWMFLKALLVELGSGLN